MNDLEFKKSKLSKSGLKGKRSPLRNLPVSQKQKLQQKLLQKQKQKLKLLLDQGLCLSEKRAQNCLVMALDNSCRIFAPRQFGPGVNVSLLLYFIRASF
jgi:hypothetical protein